jgi:hypothetical protein
MDSLAAIGLGLHSGWASAVLMAQDSTGAPGLMARRRIILCEKPEAKQPYHAAENMELNEAEAFIGKCRTATVILAAEALKRLREEAAARELAGVGLAASSTRELPPLSKLLHSHALIHAAEGVFYRETVIEAAKRLGIKAHVVTGRAASDFLDDAARELREMLERIGKAAGPPWTVDEKCASLAALSLLPGPAGRFHLEALGEPAH